MFLNFFFFFKFLGILFHDIKGTIFSKFLIFKKHLLKLLIYSLNLKSYTKIVFHTCVHNVFSFLGVKKIEDPPCGSQDISKKLKWGYSDLLENMLRFKGQNDKIKSISSDRSQIWYTFTKSNSKPFLFSKFFRFIASFSSYSYTKL